MTAKVPIFIALALMVAGYLAYPCLTLYRLDQAIGTGDAATLAQLVDWPSVREGIAEEIADTVTDAPSPTIAPASGQLAPFGHGFMHGVASHAMRSVTPGAVIARLHDQGHGASTVRLAYFEDWSRFVVKLGTLQGQSDLRVQLDLENGVWRVTRIELPAAMLRQAMAAPSKAEVVTAQFHPE